MRKVLVSFVALALLSGCASLDDLVASAPEEGAYDRYGRNVFSDLGRTSALGPERFSCDGETCHPVWTGAGIADYWRLGSTKRCVAPRDGWICVAITLEPPRGGGSFQSPLNIWAKGPLPAGGHPFAPKTVEIQGLDQDVYMY